MFRVVLEDNGLRVGEHDIYGCVCKGDIERSVYLAAGENREGTIVVEGVLHVIEFAPHVIGNTTFVGFTEYRLIGSRSGQ